MFRDNRVEKWGSIKLPSAYIYIHKIESDDKEGSDIQIKLLLHTNPQEVCTS